MSLPSMRARRKNVPSMKRSLVASALSRLFTTSSKPRAVASHAFCSSAISKASFTRRASERWTRSSSSRSAVTLSVSAASTDASWPRTLRTGPVASVSAAASSRTSFAGMPSSCSASVRELRRPTHSSPWPSSQNSPFSRLERGSR